ncbi:MAG: FG-GAP repeat domain-containing protein, partial [Nocardioidaceae bacterium]
WPDLVVRDKATKQAFVVRTGGQVRFQHSHNAALGWGGMDLLAATRDITGDGRPDMVARVASTGALSVYPGNAEGGFGAATRTTERFREADQLTGAMDLTGDGRNDLVARIKGTGQLFVYPGNGTGGFAKRRLLSPEWAGYDRTAGVGDLTGDRHADLVARKGATLYLVPGTGTGLGTPVALPGRWGMFDIVSGAGDVTNDGKADLVVRDRNSKLTYVYPGDRQGGFGHRFGPYANLKSMNFVAVVGQAAGNGRLDLVGRNAKGQMVVYANNGRRNIARLVDTGTQLTTANLVLNVGDWNGDGLGDIMTRNPGTGSLYLRAGDGPRSFAEPVLAGKGFGDVGLLTGVGDITGDGYPDLVGQPKGMAMRIYPGNGTVGFKTSYVAHGAISANRQLGIGLWNGDGSPDSIARISGGDLVVYPGNGPGGLMNPTKVAGGAGVYDWMFGVGDADGNGRPDILAREHATGDLWLLPGLRSGFGPRMFVGEGFAQYDLGG